MMKEEKSTLLELINRSHFATSLHEVVHTSVEDRPAFLVGAFKRNISPWLLSEVTKEIRSQAIRSFFEILSVAVEDKYKERGDRQGDSTEFSGYLIILLPEINKLGENFYPDALDAYLWRVVTRSWLVEDDETSIKMLGTLVGLLKKTTLDNSWAEVAKVIRSDSSSPRCSLARLCGGFFLFWSEKDNFLVSSGVVLGLIETLKMSWAKKLALEDASWLMSIAPVASLVQTLKGREAQAQALKRVGEMESLARSFLDFVGKKARSQKIGVVGYEESLITLRIEVVPKIWPKINDLNYLPGYLRQEKILIGRAKALGVSVYLAIFEDKGDEPTCKVCLYHYKSRRKG